MMWNRLSLLLIALMLLLPASGRSETIRPPIVLGTSTALSGPAQSLGTGMTLGMEAYFSRVNSEGGLHGRDLTPLAMDDGSVP